MAQISRLRYRNGKCRHNADLRGIARATVLSRATMRNIRQKLAFAFSYNALGIPVAAGVLYPVFSLLLSPVFAGAAMALSSVSVVTNALRLIGQAMRDEITKEHMERDCCRRWHVVGTTTFQLCPSSSSRPASCRRASFPYPSSVVSG